jgi:hypothetical protein
LALYFTVVGPAIVAYMLIVSNNCTPKRRAFVVRHIVLLAEVLHNGEELAKMTMIDGGEQMMFNLEVETPGEQSNKFVSCRNIVRGDDLVFEEVLVEPVGGIRCKVVYLARYHEADR